MRAGPVPLKAFQLLQLFLQLRQRHLRCIHFVTFLRDDLSWRARDELLVREFFRTHPFDSPWDLVVLARPGIINSNNAELKASLTALWRKLMVNTPKVDGAQ